jgi:hypothetical protein
MDREMVTADILTRKVTITLANTRMTKVMVMALCINQMVLLFHRDGGKTEKLSDFIMFYFY